MISDYSSDTGESIYDISGGANFILDEDHRLILANSVFFEITRLGYEVLEEDFNFLSLVPDDEVVLFINFFKKRLEDPYNSPKTSEFRVIDTEKKEHKLILTAARIPDTRSIFISSLELGKNFLKSGNSESLGAAGINESLSHDGLNPAGRQVDQYFHFSYLVENQSEPVFVLIGDVIAYINEVGIRFFGKGNRYDIIGKSPLEFIESESRENMEKIFSRTRTEAFIHPVEENVKIRGREAIDIEISFVPVIYEGIAGFQYSIRDISLSKKSQQETALRLREIEIVNSVLKAAASGFSLSEILEKILEETVERCGFQSGMIYLKNSDPSNARLKSARNVPIWFMERYNLINIREWPYNITFYAGQPRYVENLPGDPPGIFDVKILEDLGAISYAGIPLFSENAVVGVMYVTKEDNSTFSPFEKATLEEIGKEAGTIIVKGIIDDKFEREYNSIKNFLGIALRENDRIWNTIIRRSGVSDDEAESRFKTGLIKKIGPRMDIVNNLRVIYETLLEGKRSLKPVCLDSVLRGAVYHFADMDIEYDRALYFVYANDNLSYVFINIMNIFRNSGEEISLSIRHVNEKDKISVIITDESGSGIIDIIDGMLKMHPNETLSSSNIPMYVTRLLISAYDGSIGITGCGGGEAEERSLVVSLRRCGRT